MHTTAPTPRCGLVRTLASAACVAAVMSVSVLATPALAAPLLQDGSFDDPQITTSFCYLGVTCGSSSLTGWTGNAVVISSGNGPWGGKTSVDGTQYVGLQGGTSSGQSLSQTLNLAAGQYTLSWWDAGRTNMGGNATYAVLYNGLQLGGSLTTTTSSADWVQHSVGFDVIGTTPGTLTFQYLSGTTGDSTTFLDQVSIRPVPEPASFALAAIALASLTWMRRRQPVARRHAADSSAR